MTFSFGGGRVLLQCSYKKTNGRNSRILEAFLHLPAQNFTLFKMKKGKKPIAVEVLFKAQLVAPLSNKFKSNLAGRYFLGKRNTT
jgi:hypothetical protein